ncbi:site-specific integrase, partial [Coxiella burnetii]
LDQLISYLKESPSLKNTRDRALLLVGFFGAFRRSELVSLRWEQVSFVGEGMILTLPRSKTDQTGEGERCVIPFGNEARCPVRALLDWRESAKQWEGFIFRRISKTGTLGKQAIGAPYWNRLMRQLAAAAGLPHSSDYSSHSLRRGFATESARLGASMPAIQRHGRWRSTKTVVEYVEAGRQFADSAVNVLFEF